MKYVTDQLLAGLEQFLQDNYIEISGQILFQIADGDIAKIVASEVVTFSDKLFAMIREKGLSEVEIYKRGNVSRQLFSRIRSERDYHPTKKTVFALAVGMGLTVDETKLLLEKAGYAFSSASKADLIVKYFLLHGHYDIFAINEVLDKYGFETL